MTETRKGWILFIAMLGMMSTLLANDINVLETWSELYMPPFVAKFLASFGTVIGSFVAGRIIPTEGEK